jgi:hypothetical protein
MYKETINNLLCKFNSTNYKISFANSNDINHIKKVKTFIYNNKNNNPVKMLIVLKDKNFIASFIYLTIDKINDNKYITISYIYTFQQYQKRGFATILIKIALAIGKLLKYNVIGVPFEDSYSTNIFKKLNFEKELNYFIYKTY